MVKPVDNLSLQALLGFSSMKLLSDQNWMNSEDFPLMKESEISLLISFFPLNLFYYLLLFYPKKSIFPTYSYT